MQQLPRQISEQDCHSELPLLVLVRRFGRYPPIPAATAMTAMGQNKK